MFSSKTKDAHGYNLFMTILAVGLAQFVIYLVLLDGPTSNWTYFGVVLAYVYFAVMIVYRAKRYVKYRLHRKGELS
ncbi:MULTISPECIES: hypothetical protein [Pontibacillus]|uniref:Uncharacterized protein n=1 Tax=Pontibacillus chungwhensis TaxID=265426 RepID=A0ABY8UYY8_9BACI|nr:MULTISPECIES: hypothetical protein [Pontibacillus]MCD5325888.1 hypothetical protein [Pontibacillus sp. HN14]WIF97599.1 hypothetical protein QNI29_18000 [Pontibacillus chungwhensis]